MQIPTELRYTKSHEWVKVVGPAAADTSSPAGIVPARSLANVEVVVGISAHAQEELRDVVYVELPAPGRTVAAGEAVAVVESVKAAFDIYAPVAGTISRINAALQTAPQLVNKDCYGEGWFFAITPKNSNDVNALISAEDYRKLIDAAAH